MKKQIVVLILLTVSTFTLSCSKIKFSGPGVNEADLPSLNQGSTLVSVNGNEIRQGYLDFLARVNPRIKGQLDNPATRKKILDNLVEQEILYQESLQRGLDKQTEVLEKAALYKRVIISQALLDAELVKQAKEYYEKNKETQFTKVNISQIEIDFKTPNAPPSKMEPGKKPEETLPTSVEKEAAHKKALEVAARLKQGEDFAKVAEEVSTDKMTQKKGGDMGMISRDDKRLSRLGFEALVPVAFSLKNGEISAPIETKKGFHIIKVTSELQATPFDEAKKMIDFQIQAQVKETILADLKKSAKIVYAESVTAGPTPGTTIPLGSPPEGQATPGQTPVVQPPTPGGTPLAIPPQSAPPQVPVPQTGESQTAPSAPATEKHGGTTPPP